MAVAYYWQQGDLLVKFENKETKKIVSTYYLLCLEHQLIYETNAISQFENATPELAILYGN